MIRSALIAVVSCLIIAGNVKAQELPRFEAGVILGEPTGLSGKWWFDNRSAVDVAAAWSFGDEGRFEVHADYLFHYLYPDIPGELPLYFGLGPVLYIRDDVVFGARLPIGVSYLFENAPLSAFAEIAPLVQFLTNTEFGVSGGAGLRFAF